MVDIDLLAPRRLRGSEMTMPKFTINDRNQLEALLHKAQECNHAEAIDMILRHASYIVDRHPGDSPDKVRQADCARTVMVLRLIGNMCVGAEPPDTWFSGRSAVGTVDA